jgi:hypothetical protein
MTKSINIPGFTAVFFRSLPKAFYRAINIFNAMQERIKVTGQWVTHINPSFEVVYQRCEPEYVQTT